MNVNIRMSVAAFLRREGFSVENHWVTREQILRLFGSPEQILANKNLREQGLTQGKYYGVPGVFSGSHAVSYPQWLWVEGKVFGVRGKYNIQPLMQQLNDYVASLEAKKNQQVQTPVAQ